MWRQERALTRHRCRSRRTVPVTSQGRTFGGSSAVSGGGRDRQGDVGPRTHGWIGRGDGSHQSPSPKSEQALLRITCRRLSRNNRRRTGESDAWRRKLSLRVQGRRLRRRQTTGRSPAVRGVSSPVRCTCRLARLRRSRPRGPSCRSACRSARGASRARAWDVRGCVGTGAELLTESALFPAPDCRAGQPRAGLPSMSRQASSRMNRLTSSKTGPPSM